MSERKSEVGSQKSEGRRRRPRVALCAAITFDGKLDAEGLLPRVLHDALALAEGDRLVAESADMLPPEYAGNVSGVQYDPAATVRALRADPGVRRVLCLGGWRVFRALLDAVLVDDLYLLVRPRVDGRGAAPTLSGPPTPEFFSRSVACRLRRMEVVGGECLLHYTITRAAARAAS